MGLMVWNDLALIQNCLVNVNQIVVCILVAGLGHLLMEEVGVTTAGDTLAHIHAPTQDRHVCCSVC